MANEIIWTPYEPIVTYLSTELNSLASGANVLGAAIDFAASGADRKQYLDVEIYLASVDLSAQTNPAAYLWLLARTDGTNFEDGGASVSPARQPDKIVPLRAFNGAQRVFARFLLTTPDQGKLLIGNRAGAAWAASGNTVKYYLYGEKIESE
jgi:hypothetical protein